MHKYGDKKFRAKRTHQIWDDNVFAGLEPIEQGTDYHYSTDDKRLTNYSADYDPTADLKEPSEEVWE